MLVSSVSINGQTKSVAAKRRSTKLPPLSAYEELLAQEIERSSHSASGRSGFKVLIDTEILAGFVDPDEIEYEHMTESPYQSAFRRDGDIEDGASPDPSVSLVGDFRDHVHGDECQCVDGQTCIICCTTRDLMEIPRQLFEVIATRPGRIVHGVLEDDIDIKMRREIAELFGLY